MLKAMYDFQANYPKTISFDEGEHFILHQTSVRQRNWWQVISMKGNIGFVPSNYVTSLKVSFIAQWTTDSISLYLFMDTRVYCTNIPDMLLCRAFADPDPISSLYVAYSGGAGLPNRLPGLVH